QTALVQRRPLDADTRDRIEPVGGKRAFAIPGARLPPASEREMWMEGTVFERDPERGNTLPHFPLQGDKRRGALADAGPQHAWRAAWRKRAHAVEDHVERR